MCSVLSLPSSSTSTLDLPQRPQCWPQTSASLEKQLVEDIYHSPALPPHTPKDGHLSHSPEGPVRERQTHLLQCLHWLCAPPLCLLQRP